MIQVTNFLTDCLLNNLFSISFLSTPDWGMDKNLIGYSKDFSFLEKIALSIKELTK